MHLLADQSFWYLHSCEYWVLTCYDDDEKVENVQRLMLGCDCSVILRLVALQARILSSDLMQRLPEQLRRLLPKGPCEILAVKASSPPEAVSPGQHQSCYALRPIPSKISADGMAGSTVSPAAAVSSAASSLSEASATSRAGRSASQKSNFLSAASSQDDAPPGRPSLAPAASQVDPVSASWKSGPAQSASRRAAASANHPYVAAAGIATQCTPVIQKSLSTKPCGAQRAPANGGSHGACAECTDSKRMGRCDDQVAGMTADLACEQLVAAWVLRAKARVQARSAVRAPGHATASCNIQCDLPEDMQACPSVQFQRAAHSACGAQGAAAFCLKGTAVHSGCLPAQDTGTSLGGVDSPAASKLSTCNSAVEPAGVQTAHQIFHTSSGSALCSSQQPCGGIGCYKPLSCQPTPPTWQPICGPDGSIMTQQLSSTSTATNRDVGSMATCEARDSGAGVCAELLPHRLSNSSAAAEGSQCLTAHDAGCIASDSDGVPHILSGQATGAGDFCHNPVQHAERSEAGDDVGMAGQKPSAGGKEDAGLPAGICCVLLIPCKEALRSRFPLNGTYFQTNEVFLVDATLQMPLKVK